MANERNDRDNRWESSGYRETGSYDADRFRDQDNRGSNRGREDYSRRDYGSNSFYGADRDEYGNRSGSSYNPDRGYSASQNRGGYDEWSRRGNRSFGDQYSGSDTSRGSYGDYDRSQSNRYGNRDESFFGGSDRWTTDRSWGGGERGAAEGGRGFWDKASDEVSSWFGDRNAERRREMDQHRGRGPKGYARSDDRIRDDINDRLTDDGWLDASDIEVAVSNREVTLTGTVSDRNGKRRAEDLAEAVSGVSNVQNNIRVKAKDSTTTDVDVDRSDVTAGIVKSGAGGMR